MDESTTEQDGKMGWVTC